MGNQSWLRVDFFLGVVVCVRVDVVVRGDCMKCLLLGVVCWLSVSAGAGHNLLILIADDLGLDGLPFSNADAGASFPSVPHLESMADEGVVFTRAYTYPTCSPTRAAMLTGRHGFRTGVLSPSSSGAFSAEEHTFPEAFAYQALGYATASFGKWHLGGDALAPNEVGGWDHFSGSLSGGLSDFYNWTKVVNGVEAELVGQYATEVNVDDALAWMAAQGETNWVVWMGFNAVHTPLHKPPNEMHGYDELSGTEEDITANPRAYYEAMTEALDYQIGRLLAAVDSNETTVIFLGDNGTPSQTIQPPYDIVRRAKGSLFEGGTHVPFVMWGADVEGGRTVDAVVHGVDLFATLIELGGGRVPFSGVDSRSLVPLMKNELAGWKADSVFIASDMLQGGNATGRALRGERFAVIEINERRMFFDLELDPLESANLLLGALSVEEQAAYDALMAGLGGMTNAAVSGFRAWIGREATGEVLRWESEPFLSYRIQALSALGDEGMVGVMVSNVVATVPMNEVVLDGDDRQRFFWIEVE